MLDCVRPNSWVFWLLQKLHKAQTSAFVDLLRELQPPLTSTTGLDDVESASGLDDRWLALAHEQR